MFTLVNEWTQVHQLPGRKRQNTSNICLSCCCGKGWKMKRGQYHYFLFRDGQCQLTLLFADRDKKSRRNEKRQLTLQHAVRGRQAIFHLNPDPDTDPRKEGHGQCSAAHCRGARHSKAVRQCCWRHSGCTMHSKRGQNVLPTPYPQSKTTVNKQQANRSTDKNKSMDGKKEIEGEGKQGHGRMGATVVARAMPKDVLSFYHSARRWCDRGSRRWEDWESIL